MDYTAGASSGAWLGLFICIAGTCGVVVYKKKKGMHTGISRMNPIIVIAIIIIWLYILSVTKRAKLHAWSFMWGSLGLFVIMMMTVQPLLTMPLARCVAAMAGIVGGYNRCIYSIL